MQNLMWHGTKKALVVAVLLGLVIALLSTTSSAYAGRPGGGHGRGHAHHSLPPCFPKHLPAGGVCQDAESGTIIEYVPPAKTARVSEPVTADSPQRNVSAMAWVPEIVVGLVALTLFGMGAMVIVRRRTAAA